jgi:hypothetical protein
VVADGCRMQWKTAPFRVSPSGKKNTLQHGEALFSPNTSWFPASFEKFGEWLLSNLEGFSQNRVRNEKCGMPGENPILQGFWGW